VLNLQKYKGKKTMFLVKCKGKRSFPPQNKTKQNL